MPHQPLVPGQAHHAMVLQEQRRGGHEKIGPRGLAHVRTRLGRDRVPRGTAMARLARADSIDQEEDSAGVCSGIFPPQLPVSTLYKKGEAPPYTHNTYHTPLAQESSSLLLHLFFSLG
jgi:hypothetical protein